MSAATPPHRIGLIVPSSNTTMETEVPALLNARATISDDAFTFHSSRMRMRKVTEEELRAMDREANRCIIELSDAQCDVVAYACLVAIMSGGHGYHRTCERALTDQSVAEGRRVPVLSSAGALIEGIHALGARRVSIITPYMKPLTDVVVEYLGTEGIEVVGAISLGVPDNLDVGRLDPNDLLQHLQKLNVRGADAVVLSACVQMPSLPAIPAAEALCGLPVLTAAVATARSILLSLGSPPIVPDAGALLAP